MMLDWIAPLVTLTAMEIVLGIDNIIFLTILVGRLPREQQRTARRLGLALALCTRLLLLFALSWLLHLERPLFHLTDLGIPENWLPVAQGETAAQINAISLRDLILIAGGIFLIAKNTYEIHQKLEGKEESAGLPGARNFVLTLVEIAVLDIVFSLDSVITAIGMARRDQLWVMITAMILAVGVMLVAAGAIGRFVHRHPTLKMLAVSFLILIGVMLVVEGVEKHVEKGYLYFAMAFAVIVELLNLRVCSRAGPVELHEKVPAQEAPAPPRR